MWSFVLVTVAGAIGAPARFVLDGYVRSRVDHTLPVGTMLVNLSGSLLLGFVTGLALYHALPETPRLLLGAGFCGGYTTFSTFAFETVRLGEEGERRTASLNLVLTIGGSLLAAAVGLALAAIV
jgi:CrcB protein